MANTYTKIAAITANGSTAAITFNSIPQTYTDLKVVVSARSTSTALDALGLFFNGNYASYTRTRVFGNGTSASSDRASYRDVGGYPGTNTTANVYASFDIYIPSYTSSTFKQVIVDGVSENNATLGYLNLTAYLLSSTAAITRLDIDASSSGLAFANPSTFTLYGI
jgi:hypothetical protein